MKLLRVLFITLLFASMTFASETDSLWVSYATALKNAQADGKNVFVAFYADWCVPCRVMEANVFTDAQVQKVLKENFYSARLNVDSDKQVLCDGKKLAVNKCYTEHLQMKGVPGFAILDEKGKVIVTFTGAFGATGFVKFMNKLLYEGVNE